MTIAAPTGPTEPTDARADDVVEALIEEARQRARRRRRTYGDIAVVLMFAAAAASAVYRSDITFGERPGLGTAGGAADIAGSGELFASMYVYHAVDGSADVWEYLYADGRLISTHTGHGFREQRLTPDGVESVRAEIIASGLFDPDHPPPGSAQLGSRAQIEVRNGDRLVDVAYVPDREWSPDFLRLVERLRTLQSWLPASAWAEVEATTYIPDRYAVCIGSDTAPIQSSDIPFLLPAAAIAVIDTAPLLDITHQMDPATYERTPPGEHLCLDLTTGQAQRLAATLNEELPPNMGHLAIPVDTGPASIVLLFKPILPHGVPECACYG